MADDLRLNIVSTADSKGFDKAAKDLKETKAEADKLGESFNDADKDAQHFTATVHDHAEQMRALQIEYERTTASIKKLDAEMLTVGRDDKDLAKQLRGERAWLAELKRIQRDLDDKDHRNPLFSAADVVAEASVAGTKAGTSFASSFTGALDGIPLAKTALIAGVVAVAAEAAPLIGALLGGVVSGGVGTAAMAGGLISTAKDPRVQAAARTAGSIISENFFGGSEAFIQPAVDALHSLTRTFQAIDLGGSFAKVAPTVETISHGLERLAVNIMPGLNKTLDRMGPFADVAAKGMADLGWALGKFLDDVSSSPGAVEGLDMAFHLLNGTINLLGVSIHWLEDQFHTWLTWNDRFLRAAEITARATGQQGMAEAIRQARLEFQEIMNGAPAVAANVTGIGNAAGYFAGEATKAASAGQALVSAWDALNGKTLNADEAMLAAIESAEKVKDVFSEGGKSIDGHTKASLENKIAIEQAARQAVDAAAKYLELTGDIDGAQKILDDLQSKTEKATGATGKQKDAVHALAEELFKLPAKVTSTVDVIKRTFYQEYRAGERGDAPGRASGGPITAGMPYWVGERGPELVIPERNAFVIPNGGSSGGGSSGGGFGSARPLVVNFEHSGGFPMAEQFFMWLRTEVQARGGSLAVLGIR